MDQPLYKVAITHGESTETFTNTKFPFIQVKRPENSFSTALLLGNDSDSYFYPNIVEALDLIKIWFKYQSDESYTQVFEGLTYTAQPTVGDSEPQIRILARGLGYALNATHCNTNYGAESSNSSLNTPKEIWQDLVDNYINKSFGGSATGYSLTKTKIANIASALSISFLNSPYQTNREIIDRVCQVVCAYQDGSAGPHYFVDTSGNLIINTIGSHENPTEWPDWWNTNQAGSTLEQGVDFISYVIPEKAEEFANKVVFLTDFRRPGYDYWTNNHSSLWGSSHLTLTDESTVKLVGTHSLRLATDAGPETKECWYPNAKNWGYDISKWGSEKTIPDLGMYVRRSGAIQELWIGLITSTNNWFYRDIAGEITNANEWYHLSYPVGPYHGRTETFKGVQWTKVNNADWTNINYIRIVATWGIETYVYIDDLHFGRGKIIREAYNSTSITANKEDQAILISRTAMDDSGIATDDSGMAARYAYAELLRRQKIPLTIRFNVRLKPAMLPGQKIHVHACKTSGGSFNVDKNFRMLNVTHTMTESQGGITTVTATDDLTNTFPLTTLDERRLITEYILVNNKEALDMRGGEVDLLIPHLAKDYPS